MIPEYFSDIIQNVGHISVLRNLKVFYSTQAEDDRIAQEIQKKREKEGRDLELEKQKRMVRFSTIFLVSLILRLYCDILCF